MTRMNKIKKLKKIRLHHEGTPILITSAILLLLVNAALYWGIECRIPFYIVAAVSIVVYLLMVNFFPLSHPIVQRRYGKNRSRSCRWTYRGN